VIGLRLIPSSVFAIFAKSPMNSVPLSKFNMFGQGYRVKLPLQCLLLQDKSSLLGISRLSNQPVAGYIIVTYHRLKFGLSFHLKV
jgi:hypothetical protein